MLCPQNPFLTGELNPRWKGGRMKQTSGYILLLNREHRLADKDGYVYEHRYLYEKYHNCCLLKWTVIHHINTNTSDNRVQNLEAMTVGQNIKRHYLDRRAEFPPRKCFICASRKTCYEKKTDRFKWYYIDHDRTKVVCNTCRVCLHYWGLM